METPEHETEPLPEEPRAEEPRAGEARVEGSAADEPLGQHARAEGSAPEDAPAEEAVASESGDEPLEEFSVEEAAAGVATLPPRIGAATTPWLPAVPSVEERLVPMEALDSDAAFRLRDEGDVGRLAMDLARLGQAFPVEVRRRPGTDQLQLLTGFRRVAALRFLQRDQVLVRIHSRLSDDDALLIALAGVLHGSALDPEGAGILEERLGAEGRLSAAARDMLERARSDDDSLAPELVEAAEEEGEEEVDADELAASVTAELGEVNQDLGLLAPVFEALEPGRRAELLEQLRYAAALVAYFEGED